MVVRSDSRRLQILPAEAEWTTSRKVILSRSRGIRRGAIRESNVAELALVRRGPAYAVAADIDAVFGLQTSISKQGDQRNQAFHDENDSEIANRGVRLVSRQKGQ